MAGEIAQAFVRIRPEMTGFKGETERGVRHAFLGVGKIIAGTFAAVEAFRFGKEIIHDAAQVQKSMEVVQDEFGKASEAVTSFAEGGAAKLGISARVALDTSARFGILFKNLGIGKERSAEMTVGFEKLTGALSAIRGADPSEVMNKIVLAAAGNTRGLKQLGIVVDTAGIKAEALKQGLIKTTKDAITPAIKAQAIFGIATAHLGEFMDQAKKHSGDLANRMRVLNAEWSNAKERLGSALLPAATAVVAVFADALPTALHVTGVAFRAVGKEIKYWANLIAPAFKPFGALFGGLGGAFKKGGVSGGFAQLRANFKALPGPAKVAVVAIGAIAVALAAAALAASPFTAVVLAVVGLAEGFKYAYTHSARFKAAVDDIVATVKAHWPEIQKIILQVMDAVKQAVTTAVQAIQYIWKHYGDLILSQVRAVWTFIQSYIRAALLVLKGIIDVVLGLIHGDWSRVWQGIKEIFGGVWQTIIAVLRLGLATIGNLFRAAFRAVTALAGVALSAALSVGHALVNGVVRGLGSLVALVTGKFRGLWAWIKSAAGSAYAFAYRIGSQIVSGVLGGIGDIGTKIWNKLKGGFDWVKKKAKSFWKIFSPSHVTRDEIGRPLGEGIVAGFLDGMIGLGTTMTASFNRALQQGVKARNDALRTAAARSADAQATNLADALISGRAGLPTTITAAVNKRVITELQSGVTPGSAGGGFGSLLAGQTDIAKGQASRDNQTLAEMRRQTRLQQEIADNTSRGRGPKPTRLAIDHAAARAAAVFGY